MTCTTSGLQILVTLSRRYVMTSVMVSHIITVNPLYNDTVGSKLSLTL